MLVSTILEEIMLSAAYRPGALDAEDRLLMGTAHRKLHDAQHLVAHYGAGHDAFVTADQDDMLKKCTAIKERTGIVVIDLEEAVELARDQEPGITVRVVP